MPTAARKAKYHADRKEDPPNGGLDEDMGQQDRINSCGGRLVGKLAIMRVSVHCCEREKKREDQAAGVPTHDDGKRHRG
jgi:hypothetical protein